MIDIVHDRWGLGRTGPSGPPDKRARQVTSAVCEVLRLTNQRGGPLRLHVGDTCNEPLMHCGNAWATLRQLSACPIVRIQAGNSVVKEAGR